MSVASPPALTTVPPYPAMADRAAGTYNSKAYAFGAHMSDTFNSEVEAIAANVAANAADAAASASNASASALAAAGAANYQGDYSAGTTYQIGQSCSYLSVVFIAKTVNTGVTPVDGANWLSLTASAPTGSDLYLNSLYGAFNF